jgi:hypothetical protein
VLNGHLSRAELEPPLRRAARPSTTDRPGLRLGPPLLVVLLALALGACTHERDTGMIEVAKTFVPPESEVVEVYDNSTGLTIEVGDYWARVRINDGGLGPRLLEAVEGHARAGGWEERFRCDLHAGVRIGYSRDEFKVDVSVRTKQDPVDAVIGIQRIGDGNSWPPADC